MTPPTATSVATRDGGRTSIDDAALEQFRTTIRGDLVKPGAPAYADKPIFNAMHQHRPAFIVRCTGTADVADAVTFARRHGLLVAVRGGGHSVAGHSSCDGGMVIDLTRMRGVDVDPSARIARAQGGALWGDLDRETQAFGLIVPGGVVSETGVAGLTLGGGEGWVRRKYGLTIDSLLSARVVCADGSVRTASPSRTRMSTSRPGSSKASSAARVSRMPVTGSVTSSGPRVTRTASTSVPPRPASTPHRMTSATTTASPTMATIRRGMVAPMIRVQGGVTTDGPCKA